MSDQDLDVLHPLRLVHADLLVQQETWRKQKRTRDVTAAVHKNQSDPPRVVTTSRGLTFVQVGVGEAASQLLDDVDGLQVPGALQPHDGVDGQLGEVGFVVSQQFGGQRGAGDVQKVLLETGRVVAMETGRMTRQKGREEEELSTELTEFGAGVGLGK